MANQEQVDVLRQGVEVWNEWRERNPRASIDLKGQNLRGLDLSGINLVNSNLNETDLSESRLEGAKLRNAELVKCQMQNAYLGFVDFSEADLSEANLEETWLHFSLFSETILEKTRFNKATFGRTSFSDTDLSTALQLDTCYHFDASSIDNFTLKKSVPLPTLFLQGLGLADWEIEQSKLYQQGLSNEQISEISNRVYDLRATQAVQIGPIFISYSHKDADFVDRLGELLSAKGIRFSRDGRELKAGRLEKQVDRAMRLHELVLIVLSKHSVNSDWVEYEVKKARRLEREAGRDMMIPIALDDEWKRCNWPERLREQIVEYNITDFSEWQKEDELWMQFAKLLTGIDLFYK